MSGDHDALLVISADGHISPPPETYLPYFDETCRDHYQDLLDEDREHHAIFQQLQPDNATNLDLIDPERRLRDGGLEGAWDVSRRLAEMDREGVAAELVLGVTQFHAMPFFSVVNFPRSHQLQLAGSRAYNRWMADCLQQADGRLFAAGYPGPSRDMDSVLHEVAWLGEHGFSAVPVPDLIYDEDRPSLADPYFDRFWAACADNDLALLVHAGHARPQGDMLRFVQGVQERHPGADRQAALMAAMSEEGSPFILDLRPRRVLWELMLAGVFDRHPSLRFALTEVRGDWAPTTVRWLDNRFEQGDTPMKRRPSEYWSDSCFLALSFVHRAEIEMRHEIGVNQMMFGRDYPHPEGTYPNTLDWLRAALVGVDADAARAFLGGNALRCFRLDEARLTEIARQVGPSPSDILGDNHRVPQELIEDFDRRGGYLKPAESVDEAAIAEAFEEDLVGAAKRPH